MIEYWTAISIGLLGSMHCLGMCGPIAFALPLKRDNQWSIFLGSLLYQSGRISTYLVLGLLFGSLGQGFALAGFQQALSIGIGLVMILTVLYPKLSTKGTQLATFSIWLGQLKAAMAKRFGRQSNSNLFAIGILNGLLPCGLLYMAIAGASAMTTAFKGGIFMLLFGLGTLPLMLAISVFGNGLRHNRILKLRKYFPVFITFIGLLFILRGLNLGIPYLSPEIVDSAEIVKCH